MNTRCPVLFLLLLVTAATSSSGADLLTVGTPAPPLAVERFLKGESVTELTKGTAYVIEFSGTNCAPCIRSFPHQTELQTKYPNVVFICVFNEKEPEVRSFLDKHGATMGFRVALDREGNMEKNWREASAYIGVPAAYIVGADGVIAWIGSPDELDSPLENVAAGHKLDLPLERMKLYFDQANTIAENTAQTRSKLFEDAAAAQHEQLVKHQWDEVVRTCEQAANDFPENEFHFLWHKLFALAANPRTTDEALKFAAELSAKMPYSLDSHYGGLGQNNLSDPDYNVQIARFLVQHEANDHPLLAEAATILLAKSEEALARLTNEDERRVRKTFIREISAMVAAKQGDFTKAISLQRDAVILLRERRFDEFSIEERKSREEYNQRRIRGVEDQLGEYVKAEANQAWHPRDASPGIMRSAKKPVTNK
jgi:thiol-disulfide isomerase/thioredoxin